MTDWLIDWLNEKDAAAAADDDDEEEEEKDWLTDDWLMIDWLKDHNGNDNNDNTSIFIKKPIPIVSKQIKLKVYILFIFKWWSLYLLLSYFSNLCSAFSSEVITRMLSRSRKDIANFFICSFSNSSRPLLKKPHHTE